MKKQSELPLSTCRNQHSGQTIDENKKKRNIESAKSMRSNASSKAQTHNRLLVEAGLTNQVSLDDLQKKAEELIKAKLLSKTQSSKSLWNIRYQEDELDRDLNKLISQIKKYKTREETEDEGELSERQAPGVNIDADIEEISRKISILE